MKAATLNEKVMTYIYDNLIMNDKTTLNIKHSWERDFDVHLDDQPWLKVLYNAFHSCMFGLMHINSFYQCGMMSIIFPYERLYSVLRGTLAEFVKEWSPISTYFVCEWPAITCIQ